jgi:Ca2+-transporting ATPase
MTHATTRGGPASAAGGELTVDRPWATEPDKIAERLRTDLATGLTSEEAGRRLHAVGPNELPEAESSRWWTLFLRQFANTMIVVLAVAAAVTFVIGERTDTIVIAVIVVLNAVVGFVQEYRAEQAMTALRQLTITPAQVLRGGDIAEVPSTDLVPGDVVQVKAGELVPADLRLVEVHAFRADEAALTGESQPVGKAAQVMAQDAAISDRENMAFKGTAATYGRATGLVVATGMGTEIGKIAAMLGRSKSPDTPLQRRLAILGRRLAAAALVVCAIVFVAGVATGQPAEEMFLTAVSLAVAAIPEGLPAVVTVALALGARRMATRRAVIRRLPAVETLGSVSVICTDKTGTLTENRMMVERVWTPAGTYTVTGRGYAPEGEVDGPDGDDPGLQRLAQVAAACNDAVLHPPSDPGGEWTLTGDPTEGALAALASRLGLDASELDARLPRHAEVAFDASRRRMTTVHKRGNAYWVAVKGAMETLAPLLRDEDADLVAAARRNADQLTAEGYRVLALAERDAESIPDRLEDLEAELRLAGLVAIADPPRAEVGDAVATCRAAGVTPVMITGDHPGTAGAIAERIGLLDGGDKRDLLTGDQLAALDDDSFQSQVGSVGAYARTTPEQKLRIIHAWQAQQAVVAMTGDGVNDAPALQRADIGVAMGITGTDVSKEASDMVLADDNFATIVAAVEEGRRIYDNIRRFVRYLLTTNSGEIWVMLLAPLLGLPVPLVATQILWINLITDGLPAVALGMEPAERNVMRRGPRPANESILAGGLWQHALWVGLLMAAVVIPLQAVSRAADWPWQTMVFTTLALLQLGHALAVRSETQSTFTLGLRSNWWLVGAVALSLVAQLAVVYVPALRLAFQTEALSAAQLAVVAVLSTAAFVAVEIEKWWRRRRSSNGPGPSAQSPTDASAET